MISLKNILYSLAYLALFASSNSALAKPTEKNQLHQLFDQEWQTRMERFPEFAQSMGDSSQADKLTNVSEASQQAWLKSTIKILRALEDITQQDLSNSDKINYQIFKQQLTNRKASLEFKDYQIPFLADSGFHTQIARLPVETEFNNIQDFRDYLKRLSQVPEFFQQNIDNMNAGLRRNFSMPSVVMKGFTDALHQHANGKFDKSVFYQPFDKITLHISKKQQEELRKQAKDIITSDVIASYKNLANYFENTYIPQTKKSMGAYSFPNGKAYYHQKVGEYTTGSMNAEAIHQIGLAEVKRIRAEMNDVMANLEFSGSFAEFLVFLRESPQFYAESPEELLKEASYIAKKMDGQLPKFFTKLPRQPYTVEAVPDSIAAKYTTGRYVSAPLSSTRPGTYWVNTYALDKRPLYVLESLTLHEAVPGHHLQGALNQELADLPNFRRYSYISAFGEGWALYCEKLGIEAGFYQDGYSQFGRLSYEMWRAARLVIDTGIHAFGWSREQAIALLEENSGLSKHNIRTEVDRYISWPGQALSYKIGELKIIELRRLAELKLGEKFDIRLFHDAILENGSIPLDVLQSQIELFIERQLLGTKVAD
ncbi:MAG: DUF885 domain-containing protein [Kangiellaceae bacterium]|nr:DUF885 domain-containing protein [Kangiellaceae bacterium]